LDESSFHGSCGEGDMALNFPQESTAPSAPAPPSSTGEAAGKQRLGRRRLELLKRKRRPNEALLWLRPSRRQREMIRKG